MDAYAKGLDSKQAAWGAKKYHGHHVLPDSILCEFNKAYTIYSGQQNLSNVCHFYTDTCISQYI